MGKVCRDPKTAWRLLGPRHSEDAFLLWMGGQKVEYRTDRGRRAYTEAVYVHNFPGAEWDSFAVNWSRNEFAKAYGHKVTSREKERRLKAAHAYTDTAVDKVAQWLQQPLAEVGREKSVSVCCVKASNRLLTNNIRKAAILCTGFAICGR